MLGKTGKKCGAGLAWREERSKRWGQRSWQLPQHLQRPPGRREVFQDVRNCWSLDALTMFWPNHGEDSWCGGETGRVCCKKLTVHHVPAPLPPTPVPSPISGEKPGVTLQRPLSSWPPLRFCHKGALAYEVANGGRCVRVQDSQWLCVSSCTSLYTSSSDLRDTRVSMSNPQFLIAKMS